MPHQLAYLLCATPRSGTTMLCDLLAASGQAGSPQSYFRRQDVGARARAWGLRTENFADEREFNRAYLRAVLDEGAGETGIFGLRLMWGTVEEVVERFGWLHPAALADELFEEIFGRLVYIHVSRSDKLAQAISLLKAEQSGLWHVAADGSPRQKTVAQGAAGYDARRIEELMEELVRDDAAWGDFFFKHAINPVKITYEALAACPGTEVGKIFAALGLRSALAEEVTVQTSKMANAESTKWAERFRREQEARE